MGSTIQSWCIQSLGQGLWRIKYRFKRNHHGSSTMYMQSIPQLNNLCRKIPPKIIWQRAKPCLTPAHWNHHRSSTGFTITSLIVNYHQRACRLLVNLCRWILCFLLSRKHTTTDPLIRRIMVPLLIAEETTTDRSHHPKQKDKITVIDINTRLNIHAFNDVKGAHRWSLTRWSLTFFFTK